jgi:hypothetical protein
MIQPRGTSNAEKPERRLKSRESARAREGREGGETREAEAPGEAGEHPLPKERRPLPYLLAFQTIRTRHRGGPHRANFPNRRMLGENPRGSSGLEGRVSSHDALRTEAFAMGSRLPFKVGTKVIAVPNFGPIKEGTPGIITETAEYPFFFWSRSMYLCTFADSLKVAVKPKDLDNYDHGFSLEELEHSSFISPRVQQHDNLSEDERAVRFLALSIEMQQLCVNELRKATKDDKAKLVKKLVEYANFIASDRKCAPGEIIWLRAKEFPTEHNMTVLSTVRILGETADKANDWHGSRAVFILRAMTLISHAKTIAQREDTKTKALVQSHMLGRIIDDLMEDAKT